MKQALHIFGKDIRYLRWEISLMFVLSAALTWMATRPPELGVTSEAVEMLLAATVSFLIARVIHAEAIPGDRQFWITRPYDWRSLVSAKVLFIVGFVNVPIMLAQVGILLLSEFPIAPAAGGLLWCQIMLFAAICVPIAALAAITAGTAQFLFSSLALLVIASGLPALISRFGLLWPGSVEWVRDAIALTLLAAAAFGMVYCQYSQRSTRRSRLIGSAALAASMIFYASFPLASAFAVQSRLSKRSLDASALSVSLNSPVESSGAMGTPGSR